MSNNPSIRCSRCARDAAALDKAPMPGAFGEDILAHVCRDCWSEWQKAEVMVINELRLDFMDPKSLVVLERHCREFLILGEAPSA